MCQKQNLKTFWNYFFIHWHSATVYVRNVEILREMLKNQGESTDSIHLEWYILCLLIWAASECSFHNKTEKISTRENQPYTYLYYEWGWSVRGLRHDLVGHSSVVFLVPSLILHAFWDNKSLVELWVETQKCSWQSAQ